ncbi:hypothetical protein M2459_002695 [Parabacteroides sp. PF5-5]|uniref:DUF3800 domain-containing protein n=1 Tax=unclassified Parabacteroides TaxID=2649774 RepID=UPI002475B5A8|nr:MULTISPECIES: DUF3800 domain-containing protein [unclassified Parabacteroides]MDH6306332.1 hypothetical protein [Parabacteroides sp. PH5-39]MDH6316877.1 hypothetical protein [Parabacteroides sp. PF5-13]MDH6320946.1 hypothetical protein [Parabacteroides sp. PH5-13]MDH6324678.1 hypothetical protein [Parabacteroides sp. PH5-8]MDH6328062.1 hypothetical protein [Parabacteroides sp. PH5-41]
MSRTYNLYCDESTHLQNDKMPYMLIGYIKCPYNQLSFHKAAIKDIRAKYKYKGEIKWSKVSKKMSPFFNELIDYFFSSDLVFRSVIVDKKQIDETRENFTYDDFYFKMYYQLLHNMMDLSDNYNIYIDIKDTCSHYKIKKLNTILKYNSSIRNCQFIKSYESSLMQICDVIMGAINYKLREEYKVIAKCKIVEKIEKQHPFNISKTTPKGYEKMNLFYINLK